MLKVSQKITFVILLIFPFIFPIVFSDFYAKENPYIFNLFISMFIIALGCLIELLILVLFTFILEFLFGETIVSEFLWTLINRFIGDDYIS